MTRALVVAMSMVVASGCATQPTRLARPAGVDAVVTRIAAVSERDPDAGWRRLETLVDDYGARITGSAALEGAIAWAADEMRRIGLAAVRLEPAPVRHWVRGDERARIVAPVDRPMVLLGLGGTVGTGGTMRAPVARFESLEALRASTERLDGRIAFVDQRLPAWNEARKEAGYRDAVVARLHAASDAARRGARAALVRSVTAVSLRTPHTGALQYAPDAPKIPAAAITVEDADLLTRLAARGPVAVELFLGARTLRDAQSANVIGELPGRERPDEIVLLGAHIDSWDVGQGASDNAAGCVALLEAARLLRAAGLLPKRTIRVVLFTGEEHGLTGAGAYQRAHGGDRHVAAFETDFGMAAPEAIGVGSAARVQAMAPLLPAFARFGIRELRPRAAGADIGFLVERGVAGYSLEPDGRHYFDIHHTPADTLDKIRPEDLRRNAAAIALLAWVLAEE